MGTAVLMVILELGSLKRFSAGDPHGKKSNWSYEHNASRVECGQCLKVLLDLFRLHKQTWSENNFILEHPDTAVPQNGGGVAETAVKPARWPFK